VLGLPPLDFERPWLGLKDAMSVQRRTLDEDVWVPEAGSTWRRRVSDFESHCMLLYRRESEATDFGSEMIS
jgi:hypothetical protein